MTDLSHFAAIIPAAGMSSRMKVFKPLLKLGHETIIEKVISTFEMAGIKDIIVVAGHQMQQLAEALKDKNVRLVENHDYKEGMYSSVRIGVAHLQLRCTGPSFSCQAIYHWCGHRHWHGLHGNTTKKLSTLSILFSRGNMAIRR